MTDLPTLISRLEEGSGADRELSDDILLACGWLGPSQTARRAGIMVSHWEDPSGGQWPTELRPDPVSSIDAALSLVEAKLPGWSFDLQTEEHHENGFKAALWQSWGTNAYRRASALTCKTPARAILIALLKALVSQEEKA